MTMFALKDLLTGNTQEYQKLGTLFSIIDTYLYLVVCTIEHVDIFMARQFAQFIFFSFCFPRQLSQGCRYLNEYIPFHNTNFTAAFVIFYFFLPVASDFITYTVRPWQGF